MQSQEWNLPGQHKGKAKWSLSMQIDIGFNALRENDLNQKEGSNPEGN